MLCNVAALGAIRRNGVWSTVLFCIPHFGLSANAAAAIAATSLRRHRPRTKCVGAGPAVYPCDDPVPCSERHDCVIWLSRYQLLAS